MSKTTKSDTTKDCPTCHKTECSAGSAGSPASPRKSRKPKAPTAAELLASIRDLYAIHRQTAKGYLPFRKLAAAWPEVDEQALHRLCWHLDNVTGQIREFRKQRPNGRATVTIRLEPEPPAPPAEASPLAAAASPCPPATDPGPGGPATPGAILEAPGDLDDDEPPELAAAPSARHPLDGPDNPAPEDLPLVHLSWPHVYLLRALGGLTAPTAAGWGLVARELDRHARHARDLAARCAAPGDQGQAWEAETEYQCALRAILPGEGLVKIQRPERCLELALEALRDLTPDR